MPLEDNGGAPADSMAVGSSLKYSRFFLFWNLKHKHQERKKKKVGVFLFVLFFLSFFFFFFQFSFKNDLFLEGEGKYSASFLLCVSTC